MSDKTPVLNGQPSSRISEVARELGLHTDRILPHGHFIAKIPIAELGERSFDVDVEPAAVSSTCVVFAKSEALGLLKSGYTKNKVIAAYCQAMAERVVSLIERIGVENDFFITGGIAKNNGVVRRIEKLLGITAAKTKYDSQIAGALGAAVFAYTLMQKQGATKAAA